MSMLGRSVGERLNSSFDATDCVLGADFGLFLVSRAYLKEHALLRAERAAAQTGGRLDKIIVDLGLIPEREAAEAVAAFFGFPIVQGSQFPEFAVLPETIAATFVKSSGLMPIASADGSLAVAVLDPLNREAIRALSYLTSSRVDVHVASAADFDRAFTRLYGDGSRLETEDHADEIEPDDRDVQKLLDHASEAPVIKLVNQVIKEAVETGASDIHLEPFGDLLHVRFRIDGVLRIVRSTPAGMRAAVTSRIKIMARLDIAERRLPQDGRIRVASRGNDVDFRISTIPTSRGESVVMRVLDRSRVALDFASLGFDQGEIALFDGLLRQPNGIVLVTGPTGSGKTTTLYAALKELNREEVKIFTVEDPVEYQLDGISQVPVQPAIGLDFPHALRSILRQDPDVIMIGEIRDTETAKIAVQAALTGHLVLSTLHTNSASAAITRLLDMGIEPFLLASTIRGVVAQRLVRGRCTACSQWRIDASLPRDPIACEACQDSGLSGRSTIAEVLVLDEELQGMVLVRSSDVEMEAAAKRKGMRTIYESGLAKVQRNATTLHEVLRVTRAV